MKAKKSFGQHFLVQDAIAAQLADALQTEGCAAIVEVGPGKGILTAQLLRQPLPVIAVELDRDLIPILEKRFAGTGLTIVQGDILRTHYSQHIPDEAPYVLTGNFPYNISSQIVFLCLDQRHRIPFMAGMFQYEMAARICSPPGSKEYGVISVLTQAYYKPKMLLTVKPGSFAPPPKVNSAVISLERYRTDIEGVPYDKLRSIVKTAFSQRRKKLRNTLSSLVGEVILIDMGIEGHRPEELGVEVYEALVKNWMKQKSN